MPEDSFVDRLYEATFVPDLWTDLLDDLASASGSASGCLLIYREPNVPPLFRASRRTHESLTRFVESGDWRERPRVRAATQPHWWGFRYSVDMMTPEERERDAVVGYLRALDLGEQLDGLIPLPTGEVCGLTMERRLGEGRHTPRDIAFLNRLMPDFARALMVAARLGVEAARSMTDALATLGLAAAVVRNGRALAANALFEAQPSLIAEGASGRLALREAGADRLFQEALAHISGGAAEAPRSIPLRTGAERKPYVVHMIPLRRTAKDIFSGGDVLAVTTPVGAEKQSPPPSILSALFDLTPSEARLCANLAEGLTVSEAAIKLGLSPKTGRTYLDRVFSKTGVNSQARLMLLLGTVVTAAPA